MEASWLTLHDKQGGKSLGDIRSDVASYGYCLIRGWRPEASTTDCVMTLGSVLDVERLAPRHRIQNVQMLSLIGRDSARPNSYSSEFGSGEFPLHTDYGHWQVPPRFLALRCLKGDASVTTNIVSWSLVSHSMGVLLDRAVVAPRRKHPTQPIGVLPVSFARDGVVGFRWDPLFLRPINDAAQMLRTCVEALSATSMDTVNLFEPGDTLVIDNWKVLHGRSAARNAGANRRVERVYLRELSAE